MSKETCENCKYGLEDEQNKGVYRSCYRYPVPKQVQTAHFCGEFILKPKTKKKVAKDGL